MKPRSLVFVRNLISLLLLWITSLSFFTVADFDLFGFYDFRIMVMEGCMYVFERSILGVVCYFTGRFGFALVLLGVIVALLLESPNLLRWALFLALFIFMPFLYYLPNIQVTICNSDETDCHIYWENLTEHVIIPGFGVPLFLIVGTMIGKVLLQRRSEPRTPQESP